VAAAALVFGGKMLEFISGIIHELKISMLCVGAANRHALQCIRPVRYPVRRIAVYRDCAASAKLT